MIHTTRDPLARRTLISIDDGDFYAAGTTPSEVARGHLKRSVLEAAIDQARAGVPLTWKQYMDAKKRANYLRRYPWLRFTP
jgi:hypothetical protein